MKIKRRKRATAELKCRLEEEEAKRFCEIHTDFQGEVCVVCLMNERDQLKAELAECRRKTILECADICERLTHVDKPSDQLIGADYCREAIEALATAPEPSTTK